MTPSAVTVSGYFLNASTLGLSLRPVPVADAHRQSSAALRAKSKQPDLLQDPLPSRISTRDLLRRFASPRPKKTTGLL